MTQRDLMERIDGVIRRTIESRKGEGDLVEWTTTLVPVYSESCPDCDTAEYEFAIGMLARVWCPEIRTTMVNHLMHPLGRATDDEFAGWINRWWDSLTTERMEEAMAEEGAEHEDAEAPTEVDPQEG